MFHKTVFLFRSDSKMVERKGKAITDDIIEEIADAIEQESVRVPASCSLPFLLLPMGLVGSGKTTIVRALAARFSLTIVRTDDIRDYLIRNVFDLERTLEIAVHLVIKCLNAGQGVALDADVADPAKRQALEQIARERGIPIFSIYVNTPEEVILQRLREDNPDRAYKGARAIERYRLRKPLHTNADKMTFDYVFDGSANLEPQFQSCFEAIQKRIEVDKDKS